MQTLKDIEAKTGTRPKALDQQIDLREDCWSYLETFRTLERGRKYNPAGLQPIEIAEVKALLDLARVTDVDERLKLLRLVQAMDDVAMAHYSKRRSSEIKPPEAPST